MSYEYEIFVSYRRPPPVGDWVQLYFKPLLVQWLAEATPLAPRVFVDDQIEVGTTWPAKLRTALLRSCFLVPVWSPSYFTSPWCLAELHTMRARERVLGLRTDENPDGLIFPIRFNDGEHFAEDVKDIEYLDVTGLNRPAPAFANTEGYLDLIAMMQDFTVLLAERLKTAPPWQEGWPVETPEPRGAVQPSLPRLR
jgi:hypothetical protein